MRIILVTLVERAIEPLTAIIVRLVEIDEVFGLLAPESVDVAAHWVEEIERSHDRAQPLHLRLIERIDGEGRAQSRQDHQNGKGGDAGGAWQGELLRCDRHGYARIPANSRSFCKN